MSGLAWYSPQIWFAASDRFTVPPAALNYHNVYSAIPQPDTHSPALPFAPSFSQSAASWSEFCCLLLLLLLVPVISQVHVSTVFNRRQTPWACLKVSAAPVPYRPPALTEYLLPLMLLGLYSCWLDGLRQLLVTLRLSGVTAEWPSAASYSPWCACCTTTRFCPLLLIPLLIIPLMTISGAAPAEVSAEVSAEPLSQEELDRRRRRADKFGGSSVCATSCPPEVPQRF